MSEIRVIEIRISSNHCELHGAIFFFRSVERLRAVEAERAAAATVRAPAVRGVARRDGARARVARERRPRTDPHHQPADRQLQTQR